MNVYQALFPLTWTNICQFLLKQRSAVSGKTNAPIDRVLFPHPPLPLHLTSTHSIYLSVSFFLFFLQEVTILLICHTIIDITGNLSSAKIRKRLSQLIYWTSLTKCKIQWKRCWFVWLVWFPCEIGHPCSQAKGISVLCQVNTFI